MVARLRAAALIFASLETCASMAAPRRSPPFSPRHADPRRPSETLSCSPADQIFSPNRRDTPSASWKCAPWSADARARRSEGDAMRAQKCNPCVDLARRSARFEGTVQTTQFWPNRSILCAQRAEASVRLGLHKLSAHSRVQERLQAVHHPIRSRTCKWPDGGALVTPTRPTALPKQEAPRA